MSDFTWHGVERSAYAAANDAKALYRGVTRQVLSGKDPHAKFEVRYFEIAPGGYTRLERHRHVHSVMVLRGRGYAIVGSDVHAIGPHDHIGVPPHTLHQFVNQGAQPLGFTCVVDARRDRPKPATIADIAALEQNARTKGKCRPRPPPRRARGKSMQGAAR